MNIAILRLGHRLVRDYRHNSCGLGSKSFGCSKLYMTDIDDSIKSTLVDVNNRWGYNKFNFEIELVTNWKNILKRWKENGGIVLHLTMYGINIDDVIPAIKRIPIKFL
jgi:tRNA (cytidine56-2'-O)-methyltransferase